MTDLNRRDLLTYGAIGAAGVAVGLPVAKNLIAPAEAAVNHVVVVGGGMAGVTVAKYIRMWSNKQIPVTLIEEDASYVSNIMSNLVLNGQKTTAGLTYTYSALSSTYGVKVIRGTVTSVNKTAKTVTYSYKTSTGSTATATTSAYSRLVMATGIDLLPVPGLTGTDANKAKIVHAWQAGPQTDSLRAQLVAMPVDGTFILTIPPKPYRCPPGPYERAAVVADWIKTNKRSLGNTNAQVIVLDANPSIAAEPRNFGTAFNEVHAGVVQYVPAATLTAVNADTGDVTVTVKTGTDALGNPITETRTYRGNVINVIPGHTAPQLLRGMGLATDAQGGPGLFCPVNVLSYESTVAGFAGIHVLGDSSATTQPKAGHIANQEAKICADAIVRKLLANLEPYTSPVTNSACYSPITASTASWLSVVYHYDGTKMVPAAGQPEEAPGITPGNYTQMNTWFNVLMQDTFK